QPPLCSPTSPEFDERVAQMVRGKALQLARLPEFRRCDWNDLRQEIALKVWKSRRAFNPAVACWHGFVSVVIERHARNLLRDRRVELARRPPTGSLQAPIAGDDEAPADLSQVLGQSALVARLGLVPRDPTKDAQLAADVAAIVACLPPDLREVAELLLITSSVAESARALGVPR